MCVSRIVEELFPFGHFLGRSRRLRQRCGSEDILSTEAFADYRTLSSQLLMQRLEEERERASAMDEKTFKLTLSLSVGLTVLGSTAAFLTKVISSATIQTLLTIVIGIGLSYVLAAGFVALGALRTFPTYGYGTQFLLQQRENTETVLADALARQETMNNIRHLRNETAYAALRNGLLFLLAGIIVFAATIVYQSFPPFQVWLALLEGYITNNNHFG